MSLAEPSGFLLERLHALRKFRDFMPEGRAEEASCGKIELDLECVLNLLFIIEMSDA